MEIFMMMHPPRKFNNMKGNFYLIVLLLLLTGFKSSGFHTITGFVFSNDDKKPIHGVSVKIKGKNISVYTDTVGMYSIVVDDSDSCLIFSRWGFENHMAKIGKSAKLNVWLKPVNLPLPELVAIPDAQLKLKELKVSAPNAQVAEVLQGKVAGIMIRGIGNVGPHVSVFGNDESYKEISENGFQNAREKALSTFAIDVDAASYSNVRRFLNNGSLPPADAVRVEEMINYFKYNLKSPEGNQPVAIHTELTEAPWNTKHQLLRIALKAKEVETDKLPASHLVFLIDVSGSMMGQNRLPLVKASMKMLVDQLREKDKMSIVTYAGGVDIKLTAAWGKDKTNIKSVIEGLTAGGGTAGGAGLKLAYQLARENFIKGGNNRIVLSTDGDFNIGVSSDKEMERLIVAEQESGVSISVLGFGMGNYKDSKMELIADKGHGNYAYIDNITEAKKAMVNEFGGTLFTVAKDVKVQVEFNPAKVQAYRLIGYENRLLAKEDFNNDKKIGGDMGVGHTVTALYELIPVGVKSDFSGSVDPLKYQKNEELVIKGLSDEIATVKFRYKDPHSDKSKLEQVTVSNQVSDIEKASEDLQFASAVAELGMLLRNSEFKQASDYDKLIKRAKLAKGKDDEGYRAEFIRMAESAKLLSRNTELAIEQSED